MKRLVNSSRNGRVVTTTLSSLLWKHKTYLSLPVNTVHNIFPNLTQSRQEHSDQKSSPWGNFKNAESESAKKAEANKKEEEKIKNENKQDDKKDEKQEEKKEDKEDESENKKDDASKKKRNNLPALLILYPLLLFISLKIADSVSQSSYQQGREITFQTFVNKYLKSQHVDYLIYDAVSNRVYVYLKKSQDNSMHESEPISSKDIERLNELATENRSETSHTTTPTRATRVRDKPKTVSLDYDFFFTTLSVEHFESKLQEAEEALRIPPSKTTKVYYHESFRLGAIMGPLIELGILAGLVYFLRRRGGAMGEIFGIGKVNVQSNHKVDVKFADVAGMDEAKQEITEFVSFLKEPQKYRKLGAKIPKGAILMGPPGTGKTLLAKAVAGESGVPFFSISGSDFVEMFVGVGPSRVRDLFSKARAAGKAIIYIDEIDAIGRPRGSGRFGGGNDERENTLNQLLVEMDGFSENTNIIVLASTNVDKEGLDAALLRPGRFDRQITIDKPDQKGREDIFRVHLKILKYTTEVGERISRLAELTPGFTGADIANVCNEAAINAARNSREEVTLQDVEVAIERVIGGLEKRNAPISPEEKKVIAYHEAGHALASWFSRYGDPLLKISIIPRGRALGYAQYVPQERYILSYDQLLDRISTALGGRAAEQLVFGHLSTGAKDDLQKITQIAYAAVSTYGMSKKLGPMGFPVPGDSSISVQKPYSEDTAKTIDEEVRDIISKAYSETTQLLTEKRDVLEKVAQFLLKHEKMSVEDFKSLVGPRPHEPVPPSQQHPELPKVE